MRRRARSRQKHAVKHPELAVVMATRNGEKYVEETIKSILHQTLRDFQFLIIDDCSDDTTPAILAKWQSRDPRITLLRNALNLGLAASLNKGIAFVNTPYIARIDDDDIAMPHRLETQLRFLKNNLDYVLVGSNYHLIDKNGAVVETMRLPRSDDAIRRALLRTNPLCHPSVMFRKAALIAAGGYDPSFKTSQDYELWFRMFRQGKVWNIPESLIMRRIHPMMVSVRCKRLQVYNTLRIHTMYWRRGAFHLNFYIGLIRPIIGFVHAQIHPRLRRALRRFFL